MLSAPQLTRHSEMPRRQCTATFMSAQSAQHTQNTRNARHALNQNNATPIKFRKGRRSAKHMSKGMVLTKQATHPSHPTAESPGDIDVARFGAISPPALPTPATMHSPFTFGLSDGIAREFSPIHTEQLNHAITGFSYYKFPITKTPPLYGDIWLHWDCPRIFECATSVLAIPPRGWRRDKVASFFK